MRLNIQRYLKAMLCTLSAVLLILSGAVFTVSAEGITGTLTLTCKTEEVILGGMNWNIYRVGSRTEEGFELDGDFSDYQVDLSDLLTDSNRKAAAKTLENYAVLDKIVPLSSGKTDDRGVVRFENLVPGLYLISGEELVIEDTTYTPTTYLIEIGVSGQSVDIDAYPKIISSEKNPEEIDYILKGFWRDEDGEDIVDASPIKVEIYKNNELFDTVILDKTNNWTHSWKGTQDDEWRVKEIEIPDNITVVYDSNERQFVVVNTPSSEEPPVTTTTTITSSDDTTTTTTTTTAKATSTTTKKKIDNKIPQTGQLWWPVPLLGLLGIISIAIGLRICAMEKNEKNNENN